MKLEELDQSLQEQILLLKHGSSTIECVLSALENATTLDEFKMATKLSLNSLIDEAHSALILITS